MLFFVLLHFTHRAAFLGMSFGGLLRGDSLLRHTYSDLEFRRHSSFVRHKRIFDIPYFLIRSNQSKTNKVTKILFLAMASFAFKILFGYSDYLLILDGPQDL